MNLRYPSCGIYRIAFLSILKQSAGVGLSGFQFAYQQVGRRFLVTYQLVGKLTRLLIITI